MPLDRRTFVKGALGASGAVLLGEAGADRAGASQRAAGATDGAAGTLPPPATSGIEHVVVVMMENRSFDHFLGWLPHADGRQAGLAYPDRQGSSHPTFHQTQFDGCGFKDPDHSYEGGRLQYNNGQMNGFLADPASDSFAISYYEARDRPFMSRLAQAYTTCDRYFCSILGPTYPNRFFQHAAQTDRLDDALTPSTLPTIWDQLNHHGGPTGRYYYSDFPFMALWGAKYLSISQEISQFLEDAAAGTLPNVSYVDPRFLGEDDGTSGDDHPLADIRAGDAFLSQVFHAVSTGPGWHKTVLVINYDEWGGFFDHVPPRRITAGIPGIPVGTNPASGGGDRGGHRGGRRRGHRRGRSGQGAERVQGPLYRGVAVQSHRGNPGRGQPQLLRPHLGAQTDRVALGPPTSHRPRRLPRTDRPRQPGHAPQLPPPRHEGPEAAGAGQLHPDRLRRIDHDDGR